MPVFTPNPDLDATLQSLVASELDIVAGSALLQLSGADALSLYDGSLTALGIGAGLLLTSGTVPGLLNTVGWFGADNSGSAIWGAAGFDNGDPDIDAVVNPVFQTVSYDASALSFDFIAKDPTATSLSFDLVFGSDEYPEWVDQFVDCAVVLVNGVNVATFGHDPLHPLSVIGANLAAGYFQDNQGQAALPIEYDGVSRVLKIVAPIVPGEVNHLKIGIADTGDHIYDSGLFIANVSAGHLPGSGLVTETLCTDGDDAVTGSVRDEYFDLGAGHDTVFAAGGDDIIVAGAGDDDIHGGSGDDEIRGDGGDDRIDGGEGLDTAVFPGPSDGYEIVQAADGTLTVHLLTPPAGPPPGTDHLTSIERLRFDDGLFSWTVGAGLVPVTAPPASSVNHPGLVSIQGLGMVGGTLWAAISDPDGVAADSPHYIWQASVDGQSWIDVQMGGDTYTVLPADGGTDLRVVAAYTDRLGISSEVISQPKGVVELDDGDFAIHLIVLAAPSGASVMNPLTTLIQAAPSFGMSPAQAHAVIKQVLGVPGEVDLLHGDPWLALTQNPADAAALSLEKLVVQVAVMTSLGGDDSGVMLTAKLLDAAQQGAVPDLRDLDTVAALLGLDAASDIAHEIWDRCDTIASAADVAAIEGIWQDIQSGLDVVLSASIGTLSESINQAPVGFSVATLPNAWMGAPYTLDPGVLLDGFSDPDGNALAVMDVSSDVGSWTSAMEGWLFEPPAGFKGPVEISFQVGDGQGGVAQGSQLLVVNAQTLHGHAYHWRSHALLDGVAIEDAATAMPQAHTDANGDYAIDGLQTDLIAITASRAVGDGTAHSGITSADALAALRIAVGLNPNPTINGVQAPLSPYQVIAADVNHSGTVTSADALAILRMAVQLPTAPGPAWAFVDEALDLWDESDGGSPHGASTLNRHHAAWDPAITLDAQTGDVTTNLVGVLMGDVNGSWQAPSETPDLDLIDPSYFEQLASVLGVPPDYWG